ncbi:hypothetical protein Nepgr_005203 [Nepenthes gracilis]|uniref:Uncharacterized protein n=1 Tax=Nepenthes gracilis TaxID=150966 RepID=A0AAD3S2Q8_NEPGR|nr:hypothetical protein Nepgr_005203 [Nepenthes gracilis]
MPCGKDFLLQTDQTDDRNSKPYMLQLAANVIQSQLGWAALRPVNILLIVHQKCIPILVSQLTRKPKQTFHASSSASNQDTLLSGKTQQSFHASPAAYAIHGLGQYPGNYSRWKQTGKYRPRQHDTELAASPDRQGKNSSHTG